jgi:hypothetical protein
LRIPDSPPFKAYPQLLTLGQFPNVGVKVCGLQSLSEQGGHREDVWPYLEQVIEAFGVHRLMWASDITRFYGRIGFDYRFPQAEGNYPGKHTYPDSLHFLLQDERLTSEEKEAPPRRNRSSTPKLGVCPVNLSRTFRSPDALPTSPVSSFLAQTRGGNRISSRHLSR